MAYQVENIHLTAPNKKQMQVVNGHEYDRKLSINVRRITKKT